MPKVNLSARSDFLVRTVPLIKQRRKLLRLTQEDVAAAAQVSPRLVGFIESGKPTVQLDGLERVLNVLGLHLKLDAEA